MFKHLIRSQLRVGHLRPERGNGKRRMVGDGGVMEVYDGQFLPPLAPPLDNAPLLSRL